LKPPVKWTKKPAPNHNPNVAPSKAQQSVANGKVLQELSRNFPSAHPQIGARKSGSSFMAPHPKIPKIPNIPKLTMNSPSKNSVKSNLTRKISNNSSNHRSPDASKSKPMLAAAGPKKPNNPNSIPTPIIPITSTSTTTQRNHKNLNLSGIPRDWPSSLNAASEVRSRSNPCSKTQNLKWEEQQQQQQMWTTVRFPVPVGNSWRKLFGYIACPIHI
jgi:hypothetical protein